MKEAKMTMKMLARRKAEVRAKISRKQEAMTKMYWDTLAPVYRLGNSPFSLVRKFSTGFALFEGILTSMRLVWRIRKIFRK